MIQALYYVHSVLHRCLYLYLNFLDPSQTSLYNQRCLKFQIEEEEGLYNIQSESVKQKQSKCTADQGLCFFHITRHL